MSVILSVCRGISGLGLQWGSAGGGQHVGGAGVAQRYLCCSAAALGGRAADSLEINLLPFPFQTIHDQILQEYRKIKKVSANFWPSMRASGWSPEGLKGAGHSLPSTGPGLQSVSAHLCAARACARSAAFVVQRGFVCSVCVCSLCIVCWGASSCEQHGAKEGTHEMGASAPQVRAVCVTWGRWAARCCRSGAAVPGRH